MNKNTMDFPQYRKMKNEKAFYKIIGEKKFEEIQLMGSKAYFHTIEAKQYPEMIRIQDMLNVENEWFLKSSEKEYTELKNKYKL